MISNLEFRISSDHPPLAPKDHPRDPPSTGVTCTCLGDVKLPEKLPTSGSLKETIKSCRDCGPAQRFSQCRTAPAEAAMSFKVFKYRIWLRFKSFLTLLELGGSSLHHDGIQACGTEGTVR